MNVRMKKSALQNVLLGLLNERTGAAPLHEADAAELNAAGQIAAKAAALVADTSAEPIASGGRTFVRQGGKFYIKDVQVTTAELLALVNDETRARLEKEISDGARSVGVRGDEFTQPVARGASFSTEGRGTWTDLAEIPVDTVAEFMLRAEGALSDSSAFVTGEVTATGGKQLVYRTTELMIVIPEGAKDVYIMSTQNDPADPLGAGLQLLKSVGILAEWRADPIRFYELVGTGPDAGRDFALQIDDKLKLGNFNKALKGIRTGAGKFFDFLNPFEGANIEVNFKFTEFGPALVRADVFGGKGGRTQAGGLTDTDLARLADTDYFRYESLPLPADAEYALKGGKAVPPDPRDAKPKSGDYTYNAEQTPITVSSTGETATVTPNSMTGDYGFGRALWLFLTGRLVGKAAPAAEAAPPAQPASAETGAPAVAAGRTVEQYIAENKGKEVCPGAAYFDFNSATLDDAAKAYVAALNAAITAAAAGLSDTEQSRLAITLVGTADPSGSKAYNGALAEKRIRAVDGLVNAVDSLNQSFGEDPWPAGYAKYANPAAASKWLRFVKAYWGFPNPDELKVSIVEFAKASSRGTITESRRLPEELRLREHIRRMLRGTRGAV